MTDEPRHQERFVDLESRITFHERSISVLTETIHEQQSQIRKLENQLEGLIVELRARFAEELGPD